jgi:competence protein ComEC
MSSGAVTSTVPHRADNAGKTYAVWAASLAISAVIGAWVGEVRIVTEWSPQRVTVVAAVLLAGVQVVRFATRDAHRMFFLIAGCVLVAGLAASRSSTEWTAVENVRTGSYVGEARVVGDSRAVGRGRRVVVEIEGQRFEAWVFGSLRYRIQMLRSGDLIAVEGTRKAFDSDIARRLHMRHIVGRFDVIDVRSVVDGEQRTPPLVRAANRVRGLLRDGAERLPDDRASLFTGLVYGDDSSQSADMIARFRASGLAHLTAVSGQNVVFVLTMAGPLLSRLRRPTRIGVTVIVLAWFAILTRLEPSVVRAVTMAGISAVMVAAGRPVSSWLALCTTVVVVSLVDPFLIWSIGWWLSVSGCVGLIVLTPAITRSLERLPPWARSWMAPTIAAQTGVLGVVVSIFGWPSALAVPCNLLAAPVAGLVMLMGMPVALVAGVLPAAVGSIMMWPIGVAVGWVDGVALMGSRLDPPGAVDVIVSLALVGAAVRALIGLVRTSR